MSFPGETTVYHWLMSIRGYPAPWAELEFENLIITLNSEFIRDLERPDLVAEQWDAVMRGMADLAAKPAKFPRKERFVADVQISAGVCNAFVISLSAHTCVEYVLVDGRNYKQIIQ